MISLRELLKRCLRTHKFFRPAASRYGGKPKGSLLFAFFTASPPCYDGGVDQETSINLRFRQCFSFGCAKLSESFAQLFCAGSIRTQETISGVLQEPPE